MSDKPSTAKPGNNEPASKGDKKTQLAVKTDIRTAANNQSTTSSGSSVAVVAALISTITAGGAFYLWKELTSVQHTVANTVGIDQADLDKLKLSLEQSITTTTGKTETELKNTVAETKGTLEKQITESSSKAETLTATVQTEAKESISSIETALVETKASLEQNRSEVENIITTTKGEFQQELSQAITSTSTEIATTKQELSEVKGYFGDLRQEVDTRLKTAEEAQATLQAAVEESQTELKNAISRNRTDWAVAEVEHILRLANEQVALEQNSVKAITTLRTADQRLQSIAAPALAKVREALEQDIASLAKVEVLDTTAVALTLGRLSNEAEQLRTVGSTDKTTISTENKGEESIATAAEIVADNSLQAIKGFATAAFEGIGSLVVIKKDDKAFAPVIPPSQAFFVRQNLQLKLETARIALLKQDNSTFHDAIKTAKSWTEQYFNNDLAGTQQFVAELTKLSALNLEPNLPDISGSLKALQEVQPELL